MLEQLRTGGHALGPALARDPVLAARAVPSLPNCRDIMQVGGGRGGGCRRFCVCLCVGACACARVWACPTAGASCRWGRLGRGVHTGVGGKHVLMLCLRIVPVLTRP